MIISCHLSLNEVRLGTAWLVRVDLAVTACHCVDSYPEETFTLHGFGSAHVIEVDHAADIALLRLQMPCNIESVALATEVARRAPWFATVFPDELGGTRFTLSGRVTDLDYEREPHRTLQLYIEQGATAAWEGASGSAVVVNGEVIGVITEVVTRAGSAFAATATAVQRLIAKFDGVVPETSSRLVMRDRMVALGGAGTEEQEAELFIAVYRDSCARRLSSCVGVEARRGIIEAPDLLRFRLQPVRANAGGTVHRSGRVEEFRATSDELLRLLHEPARRVGEVLVLLGEAGAGKTTLITWLAYHLLRSPDPTAPIPVILPLGEWSWGEDDLERSRQDALDVWLADTVQPGGYRQLKSAIAATSRRLVLLVDGWNEQPSERLDVVSAFLTRETKERTTAVIATRPVVRIEPLWLTQGAHAFEIQRRTLKQLRRFFEENGCHVVIDNLPMPVLDMLRLPLFASQLLRRISAGQPPSLSSVSEVFEALLYACLGDRKTLLLPPLTESIHACLARFAHSMTLTNRLFVPAAALRDALTSVDRTQFLALLLCLIQSGLLRRVAADASLSPNANENEASTWKIGFFHQSIQEYLTAYRMLEKDAPRLPEDVSANAFWREVPIHMVQMLVHEPSRQAAEIPHLSTDYHTQARMIREITNDGFRRALTEQLATTLVDVISKPDSYPYAIEAFSALGDTGRQALRACLSDQDAISGIVAVYEQHLIDSTAVRADEAAWRPLGRAVYLLGELGDIWLLERFCTHVVSIRSVHLLYHVAEAILTLSRDSCDASTPEMRPLLLNATDMLTRHSACDDVICAYAQAVRSEWSNDPTVVLRDETLKNILLQGPTANPHYADEFWRRAHGVEAFAETAPLSNAAEILQHLFATEDANLYENHPVNGYALVQSSILKAAKRLCDRDPDGNINWELFIDTVLKSQLLSKNEHGCRHLEDLLLKNFNREPYLTWIQRTIATSGVGNRLRQAVSNVLYYTR